MKEGLPMSGNSLNRTEKILILAKTYPSPSAKYGETSCIAGITDRAEMRRIYPVPYRRLEGKYQFSKWQWVEVETYPNTQDIRKESRKIYFDRINLHNVINTKNKWKERMSWAGGIPQIDRFKKETGNEPYLDSGISLALYKPALPVKLEIMKASQEHWSEKELSNLRQVEQADNSLFSDEGENLPIKILEKIPYDFYYSMKVKTEDGLEKQVKLKLIDWEVCALYRKCVRDYGPNWTDKFKNRIESEMNSKNLHLLLGNQHRFHNQWMAVSLIYPPKTSTGEAVQGSLF